LGWAFHHKVGAKTPFFKMWGTKTVFQKTFNFVDTSTTQNKIKRSFFEDFL
jgi:hypothetical protein